MKQLLIIGLKGPHNPDLLKSLIAKLQEVEPNLEILHANHAHDGGPGIYIGTAADIAAAGVRVVEVPASEVSEHSLMSIGTDVKKLLQEFRAEVRREVKDDKAKTPKPKKNEGGAPTPELPKAPDAATPQDGETGASAQADPEEKPADEPQPPEGGDVQA